MAPYWILAAFAAGIGACAFLPPPGTAWATGAALILAGGWIPLRHRTAALVPLAGAIALAGFLWAHASLLPPATANHIARQTGPEPLAIEGTVLRVEPQQEGSARLDVAVARIGRDQSATDATGTLRLTLRHGAGDLLPGERICWRGRVRQPLRFGTPGEFDYPRYLAARGIYATAALDDTEALVRLAPTDAAPTALLERWRSAIASRIAATVPPAEAGLVQALTVGSGGGISPRQRQLLADAGLAHLFSISGLHFGLLALLLYGAARWLYSRSERLLLTAPPRRILPLLLLIPLAGYLLLSGNAAPTRRAFGMTVLGALLFSCNRRTGATALLATVALGMLIISPLTLFEPSFQLSFAGVLGLVVWVPRWQRYLPEQPAWRKWFGLTLLSTCAASLATAPFALWHFHQVAPAGLLVNLFAIPLITWGTVPAGLAGSLLLPVSPWLADLCFTFSGALTAATLAAADWCLRFPPLKAHSLYVTWPEGLGVFLLTAAGMLPGAQRRLQYLIAGAAVLLICWPAGSRSPLQITAISVGQGDATLVSFAGERHYLVDGGGLTGSTIDIGERLVAPALGRLGARHLAGVILTHDHPDHSAGLPFVLDHFRVDGFWSALPAEQLPAALLEVLVRREIPVHTLADGWTPLLDSGPGTLTLFVPSQEAADPNDRSVVVHAAAGDNGALLTGDLAVYGFAQLCDAGLPEPVNLLKLPHHGSRGSRPERFLDRLRPRLAFLSAGRDNSYGLPHPDCVTACRTRGIPLYRTDLQGTLVFGSGARGWQVDTGGAGGEH